MGNLLAKLGLRNRAEAAAYATRQNLGTELGDLPDTSRPPRPHAVPIRTEQEEGTMPVYLDHHPTTPNMPPER